ncbi:response regulator [Novosphingobium fluoreni]|uniref:response regulator n=1 Tax=Novosphingobium fluoreni TaxID=1391222 RepID=UPI003DA042EC
MHDANVLVVDDIGAIVEELVTLMALHGIRAVGAADLTEAIDKLENGPELRVISCDVRLDRECGLDIIDKVASHPTLHARKFSYLFVSGDQTQIESLETQSDIAILSKPVQPRLLIDTLKRVLLATNG